MDAQTRRQAIAKRLEEEQTPISATTLAKEFSVSRQIIVGDIALLRASGLDRRHTKRICVARPRHWIDLYRSLQPQCHRYGDGIECHRGSRLYRVGCHRGAPHLRPDHRPPAAVQPV